MMNATARLCLVAPLLLSVGCKEYFSVDEACHPKGTFRGDNLVSGGDLAAIDRWNCYRRLVNFERAGVVEESVQVATDVADYVVANPDLHADYFRGDSSSIDYLTQDPSREGFSGVNIWERIDTADYPLLDVGGTRVYEIIGLFDTPVSGAEVIDYLTRVYFVQDFILTPSLYDVGYHEASLDAEWWQAAFEASGVLGTEGVDYPTIPAEGTIVYALVIAQAPPIEGAAETPITFPKRDQTGVPTAGGYTYDRTNPDPNSDGYVDVIQLSYPIGFGYVSLTPVTGTATNPYAMDILAASIVGPNNTVLPTVWVDPGEAEPANTNLELDGSFQYWMGSIMATQPFEPNTPYTVYVDYATSDGTASHDFTFTTAGDDATATARTRARSLGGPGVHAVEAPPRVGR